MDETVERRIGDLTVRIDRNTCNGFGDCTAIAPELFEFDEQGIVTFRDDPDLVQRARIIDACRICPVDALTVTDGDGRRHAPA